MVTGHTHTHNKTSLDFLIFNSQNLKTPNMHERHSHRDKGRVSHEYIFLHESSNLNSLSMKKVNYLSINNENPPNDNPNRKVMKRE